MTELDEKVLVACPTYRGKAYALEAYIRAFNDFTWPQRSLYMVDNTGDGLKYFDHLKSLNVDCEHIQPSRDWQETFARSWKKIMRKAVDGKYRWVASIEADVICPPLTLDILMNIAAYCKALHVAHSYSWHSNQTKCAGARLIGLGCNLISVEILEKLFAREVWLTDAIESEIYEFPKVLGVPTVEIHNLIDVRHLDDTSAPGDYIFDRDPIPTFTHGLTVEGKPFEYTNAPPKFDLSV